MARAFMFAQSLINQFLMASQSFFIIFFLDSVFIITQLGISNIACFVKETELQKKEKSPLLGGLTLFFRKVGFLDIEECLFNGWIIGKSA